MVDSIFYFIIVGIASGTLGGLLGIGGGLLIVPLLTFIFFGYNFPQEEIPRLAVGTSQATIVFISLSAVYSQYKQNMFSLTHFWACVPAILVGTCVGGLLILFAPALMLTLIFCCALVISMFVLFFSLHGKHAHSIRTSVVFFPIAVLSAISSAAGIGGGGLFTAYFSYIHLPVKESIALSMSLVLPMSIATTFYVISGHSDVDYTFGLIYYPAFLSIVIPAVICAHLGVRLRSYIPYKILQKILACMLLASGIYLVYKTVS